MSDAKRPGDRLPGEEKTVDGHVEGTDSAPGAGLEREDAQPDEALDAVAQVPAGAAFSAAAKAGADTSARAKATARTMRIPPGKVAPAGYPSGRRSPRRSPETPRPRGIFALKLPSPRSMS